MESLLLFLASICFHCHFAHLFPGANPSQLRVKGSPAQRLAIFIVGCLLFHLFHDHVPGLGLHELLQAEKHGPHREP